MLRVLCGSGLHLGGDSNTENQPTLSRPRPVLQWHVPTSLVFFFLLSTLVAACVIIFLAFSHSFDLPGTFSGFLGTPHDFRALLISAGKFGIITFDEFIQIGLSADRVVGIYPECKNPVFINEHVSQIRRPMHLVGISPRKLEGLEKVS